MRRTSGRSDEKSPLRSVPNPRSSKLAPALRARTERFGSTERLRQVVHATVTMQRLYRGSARARGGRRGGAGGGRRVDVVGRLMYCFLRAL